MLHTTSVHIGLPAIWRQDALLEALFSRVLVIGAGGTLLRALGREPGFCDDDLLIRLRPSIERALNGEESRKRVTVQFGEGLSVVVARAVPVYGSGGEVLGALATLERPSRTSHAVASVPAQARQLRFVLENIRQGIWLLDGEGVILDANRHLAEWLETTEEALLGQPATRYLISHTVEEMDLGPAHRYEAEFQSAGGIRRRALVDQISLPDGDGRATFALITDLTADSVVSARLVAELQQMASLARQDSLTGLLNRRAFAQALDAAVEQAGESPFGVIYIDLDDLKPINDLYGHEAGDRAIKAVAERLIQALRDDDTIARIGGDEFAVIVRGVEHGAFRELVRRIQTSLKVTLQHVEPSVTISASVGGAHSQDGPANLLSAADAAMYHRKRRQKRTG